MRYTDRDCLAALICAVAAINRTSGTTAGIVLPEKSPLADLADRLGVPRCSYVDEERDRYTLDHCPACYGGGVRPMLLRAGCTGHSTPRWWAPSAGLGPGAVSRKEFCHILRAVEGALAIVEEVTA